MVADGDVSGLGGGGEEREDIGEELLFGEGVDGEADG